MVIGRLDEIIRKCAYNAHLISEQVVTLNVSRSNQESLDYLRKKVPECLDQELTEKGFTTADYSKPEQMDGLNSSSQDILFQLIQIGLRFFGKSAVKTKLAIQIIEIVRTICRGKRYLKCHLELVYQYVKVKVDKILAKSICNLKISSKIKFSNTPPIPQEKQGFGKIDYCTQLLHAILEQQSEFVIQTSKTMNDESVKISADRCPSYFYFSGYLSGILLGEKPLQPWPFNKGFAACLWFRLHERQGQIQDPLNLPVLFNCASAGFGGFECYFNGFKLYYRILPPLNYQPPTVESNGVLIADFTPGIWNFLAIEHEKPFLARAQLIAVVNDKQVVNFPMDYPNFDKTNSKLNMVSICKNFVGQLTSFILFKEQVNNPQKFVQMYKAYEFGVGVKSNALNKLNPEIFDQKFIEKFFLMFTPQRTQNKILYDYIDQNDGELLINCGVWFSQTKLFLAEVGGLTSLLPLLECISKLIGLESERKATQFEYNHHPLHEAEKKPDTEQLEQFGHSCSQLINNYLRLVLAAVSDLNYSSKEARFSETQIKDLSKFLKVLLLTISKLPNLSPEIQAPAVNCQTIQLLADLRFCQELMFSGVFQSNNLENLTRQGQIYQHQMDFQSNSKNKNFMSDPFDKNQKTAEDNNQKGRKYFNDQISTDINDQQQLTSGSEPKMTKKIGAGNLLHYLTSSQKKIKTGTSDQPEMSHFENLDLEAVISWVKAEKAQQDNNLKAVEMQRTKCQELNEEFFLNLMFTCDFWVNTQDLDVINEFWGFVKAIYSQNPVLYNHVFPIQNLIDFMLKISDISKEGAFCCQYHRKTFQMFFAQNSYKKSITKTQDPKNSQQVIKKLKQGNQQQIVYDISKYLEPIAAVLENVLTSGGDEILDQIQYIAKSLTVKSCPCFQLQMLQLLKVLLLDSRSEHDCASPIQFASRFLNVKGLQILLYLCQNASLDVKAMCIKIIDVLSSQTSLIQMRIDTDLITYLSHIILPEQVVQQHLAKQWQNQQNIVQHAICEEGEQKFLADASANKIQEVKTGREQKKQLQDLVQDKINSQTTLQFYAFQEVSNNNLNENSFQDEDTEHQALHNEAENEESFDEVKIYKAPIAPRGGKQGRKPLFIDQNNFFSDEEDSKQNSRQNSQGSNEEKDFKANNIFAEKQSFPDKLKKVKFQNLVVNSDDETQNRLLIAPKVNQKPKFGGLNLDLTEKELSGQPNAYPCTTKDWAEKLTNDNPLNPFDDAFTKKNDEEPPKPSADVLMSRNLRGGAKKGFNFAAFMDDDSDSVKEFAQPQIKALKFKTEQSKKFLVEIETESPQLTLPSAVREKKIFEPLIVKDSEDQIHSIETKQKMPLDDFKVTQQNLQRPFVKQITLKDQSSPHNLAVQKIEREMLDDLNLKPLEMDSEDIQTQIPSQAEPEEETKEKNSEEEYQIPKTVQRNKTLTFQKNDVKLNLNSLSLSSDEDQFQTRQVSHNKDIQELNGGTTGATNDMNIGDSSYGSASRQAASKINSRTNKKPNFNLAIDTDEINKQFNYGGEKGSLHDEEAQMKLEYEIQDLARICVQAMNRSQKKKSTFQELLEQQNLQSSDEEQKKAKEDLPRTRKEEVKQTEQIFMVPQAVKGIKIIESIRKEKEAKKQFSNSSKPRDLSLNYIDEEEMSPKQYSSQIEPKLIVNDTVSTSIEHLDNEVIHSGQVERFLLNLQCDEAVLVQNQQQKKVGTKNSGSEEHELGRSNEFDLEGSIDSYTQELENLYTSCLEWLLNRAPSSLFKNLVIDDYDKITFKPALQILMTLVSFSNNMVRQRALQDLFMLAQWDSYCLYLHDQSQQIIANQNGQIILQHPKFHNWLLELLMPYQDLMQIYGKKNTQNSVMSESSRAVYDMGCKLHTLLLKNACLNPEEDGLKKINLLTRWPALIQIQVEASSCNTSADANKSKEQKQKNFSLTRHKEGGALIETDYSQSKDHNSFDYQQIVTAHGLARSLLTNLIKQLKEEATRSRPQISLANSFYCNIVHITMQVEELILSSHSKSPTVLASEQNAKIHLSEVNESLFTWVQRGFLLITDNQNDGEGWAEWDLIEALLQALDQLLPASSLNKKQKAGEKKTGKTNEDNSQLTQETDNTFAKSPASIEILMYEGKPNSQPSPVHTNVNAPKPSRMGAFANAINNGLNQAVLTLTNQQHEPQLSVQLPDCTFMKALMNLICLAISQSYNKDLTLIWLDRLERFVKLLLTVSEAWKLKTDSYTNSFQRKIAEQVAFAFTFLFHEVHDAGTPTSAQLNFPPKFSTSPQQADVQHSKLFQQSLKNLLIFFINIVYTSNSSAGSSQKQSKDFSASRIILNNILVKEFSSSESLFSSDDINFLKDSQFEDFPELFYQNDWKVTFFHNSVIQGIVQRQLNLKLIEQFDIKRRNFVQRVRDTDFKTEKAKDEILKKIQTEIFESIGVLSELEFERKNKDALLLDNFIRNRITTRNQCMKKVKGARGMWRQDYDNQFYNINSQLTGEGTRVLLKDRQSNQLRFIKNTEDCQIKQLEQLLFNRVFNKQALVLAQSDSYSQIKDALKDFYSSLTPKALPLKKMKAKQENSPNESEDSDCENEEDEHQQSCLCNEVCQHKCHRDSKVYPKGVMVSHFSKKLSLVQKQDLKRIYVTHLKEQLFLSKKPKRKDIIECRCELMLPIENRKGTLCMTNYELIFFYDLDIEEESKVKNTIHFFSTTLSGNKPYHKEVQLCFIKELQKRRFIGQKTALEIFLVDNKSMLLKFENPEIRDEIAKKILRQRKNKCKNLKYYTSLEPKWILKKKNLTEDWQNWKISNFDYIMQLNQLAGRSFNDISQYPVLPWILSSYQSTKLPDLTAINQVARGGAPPGLFRDLTKNMQLLGSAVRQAEFKHKFEDTEGFIGLDDRFHCGSHYSNPGIVLHYLSRMHPYLEANIELHGKTMDHPDRVFASLDYSFNNALNDFSDVRELIPEFYFLPEIFQNLNNANFGVKQDGSKVNNVKLPPWTKQDPFKFVQVQREAFESPYVSANLHTWIDYIFGYKQRGPYAEMSLNTFSRITYQPETPDDFDISKEPDPILRNAYENQAYNYGQTPTQLFKQNDRHPQKNNQLQALRSNLVVDIDAHLKVFKPVSGPKNGQTKQPKQLPIITKDAIMKARFIEDQRIVGVAKDGFAQHFVWLPRAHDLNPTTPFSLGGDKKLGYDTHEKEGGVEQIDRSIKKFDLPLCILKEGKQIVKGGFWDGRLAFCPTEGSNLPYIELHGHTSTITTLVCDKKESVMVTGSKSGEVIIWKNSEFDYTLLNNDPKTQTQCQWVCFKQLNDHDRQVSSLYMNEEMCLFVSGSYDGTCNLYNMYSGNLLRTFKHPTMAPVYSVFISLSPLAICSFFSREDHLWTVYSINGTLFNDTSRLSSQEKALTQRNLIEDCSHIIACQVIKDSQHIDKLVYGTEKGFIVLRLLPDMVRIRKLVVANNNPVLSILVSPDRRFLHVGCSDGGLIVITERNTGQQQEKLIQQKK